MVRRRTPQPAFTLLEVILAIALASALIGGMLGFYHRALSVREAVMKEVELVRAVRLIMERMTQELRGAVAVDVGMQGLSGRARFACAVLPSPVVWLQRQGTEDPLPPEQDVQLVGYRLRTFEDEYGQVEIVGLERTCQKVLRLRVATEGVEITPSLLTSRIKFLNLRYWDGTQWTERWGGGALPVAVEITLGVQPLPEETDPLDYPYTVFQRVVYVPAGQKVSGRRRMGGPGVGGAR